MGGVEIQEVKMEAKPMSDRVQLFASVDWTRRLFDALIPLPDGFTPEQGAMVEPLSVATQRNGSACTALTNPTASQYTTRSMTHRKQICRTHSLKSVAPSMIFISTRMK